MTSNNPPAFDHLVANNGQNIRAWLISIGVWNMDATVSVSVPMPVGFDHTKCIHISAVVRKDDQSESWPLTNGNNSVTGVMIGSVVAMGGGNIILNRVTGGGFDGVQWSSAVVNRGIIFALTID